MSYCRFGKDSEVYLYHSINGGWECCSCRLTDKKTTKYRKNYWLKELRGKTSLTYQNSVFRTRKQALKHLTEHKEHGHKVPYYAFTILEREINETRSIKTTRKRKRLYSPNN